MIIVIYYAKYRKLLLRKNLNYFIKPKRKFPIYKDNSPEQLKLKIDLERIFYLETLPIIKYAF